VELGTINRWLRRVGLVLVIQVWDHKGPQAPTKLWIERYSQYVKWTGHNKAVLEREKRGIVDGPRPLPEPDPGQPIRIHGG